MGCSRTHAIGFHCETYGEISPSRTHAVGFHYETYGEISSSRTPALLLSLILPFQKDIRTRKCILHRWYDKMGSSPHQALA